jgi:hypothetical protein
MILEMLGSIWNVVMGIARQLVIAAIYWNGVNVEFWLNCVGFEDIKMM